MKGGRDELVGRNGMDNWFSGLFGLWREGNELEGEEEKER